MSSYGSCPRCEINGRSGSGSSETIPITTNPARYPNAPTSLPMAKDDQDSHRFVPPMNALHCVAPNYGFVMSMNMAYDDAVKSPMQK
jgi:hypothetical protein